MRLSWNADRSEQLATKVGDNVVLLHRMLSDGSITPERFLEKLSQAGYDCSPKLVRTVKQQTEILLQDVLKGLQQKTPTLNTNVVNDNHMARPRQWQQFHPREYMKSADAFDHELHNPVESRAARQIKETSNNSPKSQLIWTILRLASGRNALDATIGMLTAPENSRGIHIHSLNKGLKNLGIILEQRELQVLKQTFGLKGPNSSVVNAKNIGLALIEARKWHGNRSFAVRPAARGSGGGAHEQISCSYDQMGDRRNDPTRSESDATSIVSTATFGTANIFEGFNSGRGKSYNQIRDESIYSRLLNAMIKGRSTRKLRLLRERTREISVVGSLEGHKASYASEVVGSLSYPQFLNAICPIVPNIPEADYLAIFDNLHPDKNNEISCSSFYNRVRGPLSSRRVNCIDVVFRGLIEVERKLNNGMHVNDNCNGDESVSLDTILSVYEPSNDPDVVQSKSDVQAKMADILDMHNFVHVGTRTVTRKAWFDYFGDVSASVVNDDEFEALMYGPWGSVVHLPTFRNGLQVNARPLGFHEASHALTNVTSNAALHLLRVFKRLMKDNSYSDTALRQLFNRFDNDGSGYISPAELCIYFARLKIPISADVMEEFLEMIDKDGDGMIGFGDFSSIIDVRERAFAATDRQRMVKTAQAKILCRPELKDDELGSIHEPLDQLINHLSNAGAYGFEGYGDILISYHTVTHSVSPWVTKQQIQRIFSMANIALDETDAFRIFRVFQSQNAYQDSIHFWQLMNELVPKFTDHRKRVTQRVFKMLDQNNSGFILFRDLVKRFYADGHPHVRNGRFDAFNLGKAVRKLLSCAGTGKEKIDKKTWHHMMKHTLSACCQDDSEYEEIMTNVWRA